MIRECRIAMVLKPQDIYVLLKLVAVGHEPWSYSRLGLDLGMSPSEVHGALKRALRAGLAVQGDNTAECPHARRVSAARDPVRLRTRARGIDSRYADRARRAGDAGKGRG